jgi:hypothetical protein
MARVRARTAGPDDTLVLWRRIDPQPDEYPDAGGVATPVAQGLASLSFQAFNGEEWLDRWDSDRDGIPHAVRTVLRVPAFAADGSRLPSADATARRVVAMDRPPLPYVFLSPLEREEEAAEEQEANQ